MLNDFVFLDSQPPIPTCRHMGSCSLSLYLGDCASCEFFDSFAPDCEPVSLSTAELLDLPARSKNNGRAHRGCGRRGGSFLPPVESIAIHLRR